MKKTILLFLTLAVIGRVYGQTITPSVYASAGDYSSNTNASLSWTIGECIVESAIKPNAILTQGFQQPAYYIISNSINETTDFRVSVYPNPSPDYINLKFESENLLDIEIVLFDLAGKALLADRIKIDKGIHQLDFRNYTVGTYILKILSSDGEFYKTYKIQKVY